MSPEADVPVGAVGAEDVGTEGGMQDAVHRACVRRKHVFKVVVPVHCTLQYIEHSTPHLFQSFKSTLLVKTLFIVWHYQNKISNLYKEFNPIRFQ